MNRNFMDYEPTLEDMVEFRMKQMYVSEYGSRLAIASPVIAAALKEYRKMERIPDNVPTYDLLRERFERWYITELARKDLESSGSKKKRRPNSIRRLFYGVQQKRNGWIRPAIFIIAQRIRQSKKKPHGMGL